MSHYVFAPGALADLRRIHDYVAENSPANALRLIERIENQCYRLADQPYMGVARPEFNRPNLRSLVVRNTPYIIFYYPTDGGVVIAHIRHGRRELTDLFD